VEKGRQKEKKEKANKVDSADHQHKRARKEETSRKEWSLAAQANGLLNNPQRGWLAKQNN